MLAGLKPAIMLDYCFGLQANFLQRLLDQLRPVTGEAAVLSAVCLVQVPDVACDAAGGALLCTACLDGCCYVLRVDRLLAQLEQLPLLVCFEQHSHATRCHQASEMEQQVRVCCSGQHSRLRSLLTPACSCRLSLSSFSLSRPSCKQDCSSRERQQPA